MINPMKQYELELREALESAQFPADKVPKDFSDWLDDALRHETNKSLQCEWETFKQLMTTDSADLNLYQMSFAINAVSYRTMYQLSCSPTEYIALMDEVSKMASTWNKLVEPIKEGLNRKFRAMQRIKR